MAYFEIFRSTLLKALELFFEILTRIKKVSETNSEVDSFKEQVSWRHNWCSTTSPIIFLNLLFKLILT